MSTVNIRGRRDRDRDRCARADLVTNGEGRQKLVVARLHRTPGTRVTRGGRRDHRYRGGGGARSKADGRQLGCLGDMNAPNRPIVVRPDKPTLSATTERDRHALRRAILNDQRSPDVLCEGPLSSVCSEQANDVTCAPPRTAGPLRARGRRGVGQGPGIAPHRHRYGGAVPSHDLVCDLITTGAEHNGDTVTLHSRDGLKVRGVEGRNKLVLDAFRTGWCRTARKRSGADRYHRSAWVGHGHIGPLVCAGEQNDADGRHATDQRPCGKAPVSTCPALRRESTQFTDRSSAALKPLAHPVSRAANFV
jgi:hypothetical protein